MGTGVSDMNHWLMTARGWLYTNGKDTGDTITLSFSQGGESLAKLLQDAYMQGREDERDLGDRVHADRRRGKDK